MNNEKHAKQDEQLFYHIQRLQQGYTESYTEIYNLSGKYLYKIIYDIVQDYHTTEDMLQETFIKIYNNINSLQSPQAYYVWAGRIATNLCIRYIHKYRKEILQTATEDGEGNEEFVFDTVADDNEMFIPESVIDNKEHQRLIGDVIDRLSPEQKLAVQCFYFEEMSVKEIAELMECSEGTIKSRLNYARKSIKEAVLNIEKTQGTKLYSLGALPILLLLYRSIAEQTVGMAASSSLGGTTTITGDVGSVGSTTAKATATKTTATAATTTATSVTAASTVAAGISGKIVAIIISLIIAVGGGIIILVMNLGDNDKNEENTVGHGQQEVESSTDIGENVHGDIIPAGGKYIVYATGEVLEEGDAMPSNPDDGDSYYYEDYEYTFLADEDDLAGWHVKLNVEEYETSTEFGNILERIADEPIIDVSDLFHGCEGLIVAPKLPSEVINVTRTFSGCINLVEAPEIPIGVTSMEYTFLFCENLVEAPEIPTSVTSMDGTFYGCSSLLKAPELPEGVECLTETFYGCINFVETPDIPASVTDMSYTFSGCEKLTDVSEIPSGVVNMEGTFMCCRALTTPPILPIGVTNISYAFYGCYRLTEGPDIPETVINMKNTFTQCEGLSGVIVINANPTEYAECFAGLDFDKQNLRLDGSSDMLEELIATAEQ